jgi:hypothetical protein
MNTNLNTDPLLQLREQQKQMFKEFEDMSRSFFGRFNGMLEKFGFAQSPNLPSSSNPAIHSDISPQLRDYQRNMFSEFDNIRRNFFGDFDRMMDRFGLPSLSNVSGPTANLNNQVSTEPRHNQLEIFREFEDMSKGLFGNFNHMLERFGGGFGQLKNFVNEDLDNLGDVTKFSKIQDALPNTGGEARLTSRSYVHSSRLDKDGKPIEEKYYSDNNALRGADGTTVAERRQAYHNSADDIRRIAEERRINDQAKKIVQERKGGINEITRNNYYQNMNQGDDAIFDQKWNDFTNQFKFYQHPTPKLDFDTIPQIGNVSLNRELPSRNLGLTSESRVPMRPDITVETEEPQKI